jgi:glycosyltransferase involved in cell wall biosynthesis
MTRVLVVTNMYPPHHLGGYELSCRDVVERWKARGHEVEVLTTTMRLSGVEDPPGERASGVARELDFYWKDHVLVNPRLRERLAIERSNHAVLAAAIERFRPEVVSAWNMGAMSLGLLTQVIERDIPLVLNVCDGWLWYGPKLDAWARLFVKRPRLARLVRRRTGVPAALPDLGAHAVFCFVSEAIRRWSAERSQWEPKVATVVYSGIERADFIVPAETRDGDRPWAWKMLTVGRLDERKGIHVAIQALAHLPETATLDIVGRGDERYEASLREMVRREGVAERVRFDVVERWELAERYAAADVVLFPTLWEEPFGLVPVEAMACGTPVVATGTGGSSEFLLDGFNCVHVPAGDAQALAGAVRRISDDADLRRSLRTGGFRTAEELNVDRLADVLERWHVAAAERFSSGRPEDRVLALREPT